MYQSKIIVPCKPLQQIKNDYREYLTSKKNIYCGVLRRKISLEKQPNALFSCKNQQNRVPYIFIAIDIIKKSKSITFRIKNGCKEYELVGLNIENEYIKVHFREEIRNKNKILILTTCFRKQKNRPP